MQQQLEARTGSLHQPNNRRYGLDFSVHHACAATSSLWPELWLEIFPYLPNPDLRSASLTCSLFRQLAQPLLFRDISLSSKHLDFVTSPRIAHAVRRIAIRHCRATVTGTPDAAVYLDRSAFALSIHDPSIIRRLCDFPSISTILFSRIVWSAQLRDDVAAAVSQIPALKIKNCRVDMDPKFTLVAKRVKVNNLTIEACHLQWPLSGWSSVIEADHTDYIIGDMEWHCLGRPSEYPTPLHGLKTHVPRHEGIDMLLEVLRHHSHTIRILWLSFIETIEPPILFTDMDLPVMPSLTSYSGPVEFLSLLLSTTGSLSNMTYLRLHDSTSRPPDSVTLINLLKNTSNSVLKTLIFVTCDFSQELLTTISDYHPHLKHLVVQSNDTSSPQVRTLEIEETLKVLSSTPIFPKDIVFIKIVTNGQGIIDRRQCSLLRETLQSKYPTLCSFSIESTWRFTWQRDDSMDKFTCMHGNAKCKSCQIISQFRKNRIIF